MNLHGGESWMISCLQRKFLFAVLHNKEYVLRWFCEVAFTHNYAFIEWTNKLILGQSVPVVTKLFKSLILPTKLIFL